MRGVFLDRESLDRDDLDLNGLEAVIAEWKYFAKTTSSEVDSRIAGADIVITNKVVLTAENISRAENLKLICVAATGTNNVDIAAAREKGITVCNVRAYGTASVAQHVLMLMLMLNRQFPAYQQALNDGAWQRSDQFCLMDYPIEDLSGKTLGIIGYGELGRGVAKLAECFGMQVMIAQRPGGEARQDRIPVDELLSRADIISLHCPLTDETRNLIDQRALSLMKPGALLINAARGGIVDEAALLDALQNGRLAGAALDVLEQEPPVNGNILLDVSLPNLIITPHIAWASRQARQRLLDIMVANIQAFLDGQPQNVV